MELTLEHATQLLLLNCDVFPSFYKNFDRTRAATLAAVWVDLFRGADAEAVECAFRQALKTSEFPVTPAAVQKVLDTQTRATQPTTDELFDMADDAGERISRLWHPDIGWTKSASDEADKIWRALPAVLREWKHSPRELMHWHELITDENESYMRHDFAEIIAARTTRRDTLGIGFNDNFDPKWSALLGCMKTIDGVLEGGKNGSK